VNLIALGISHRTAPVEQREKATLSEAGTRALLRELIASGPVAEAVALSTCNRTEVYVASPDPAGAEEAIACALVAHSSIAPGELACARYALREDRAAAQVFRVAAGLDSMVVGESEIQGQVRAAWRIAAEEGSSGRVLDRLFRQALEVGKRVRSATRIGAGPASVSAAAVELAQQTVGDLADRRVLVLGAGRAAERTALALVQHGARDVVVVSRTAAGARELGRRFGGRGAGFDTLAEELAGADIVIASTGAPHPVLRSAEVASAMSSRAGRPLAIVDIAVPRDVEAAVASIAGVALFDIDDLEAVVEATINGRLAEARRGEEHVLVAVRAFAAWRRGLLAAPAIAALRSRAEEIRRAELDRFQDQWEGVSEADRRLLETLTTRIVNKLLHEPTERLRAAAEAGEAGP
jgi:glutamyl-tRNA reductase